MSEMPNSTRILIFELIQDMPKENTASKLIWAFKKARQHWLVTEESEQFQGAIGAVYETSTKEEKETIRAQLSQIRAASDFMDGKSLPVIDLIDYGFNIVKIWHESKPKSFKKISGIDRGEVGSKEE